MLLLYGSATMGATVYMHYCMNKLTGISFWSSNGKQCSNCGMFKERSHGCCKDECKQLRMQADQHLATIASDVHHFNCMPNLQPVVNMLMPAQGIITVTQVSHAPPGKPLQKLYLKNNVWRI